MKLRKRRRSPVVLFLLLLFWSVVLGWGLAQAASPPAEQPPAASPVGTVDVVSPSFQLGQEIYIANCAACHVGLPPAIMPSQTWRSLIQETQHYGAIIPAILEPNLRIVWNYLATYSRPINQGEEVPFRIHQSRFFKALHPNIKFDQPVTLNSCATCHPASAQFDYRSLSPEWTDAP
jgi:Dihaem cytochrome c